jgi:GTPase SAR1 family protein
MLVNNKIKIKKMYNTEDLGNSMMTIRYKLVFVGDISVGKTSVMNRFINNKFSKDYDVINEIYNKI